MKKVFVYDQEPESASLQLARNKQCYSLVKENAFDVIVRFYHHNPSIILANTENLDGINLENTRKLGFEVTRRPSGGSAIIATPDLALCYSIFISEKLLKTKDIHEAYKKIVLPIAENLPSKFSVEGTYYLRYLFNGKKLPITGHAMKNDRKSVVQLDGIVHLTSLDMGIVSEIFKPRTLYETENGKVIEMGEKYYSINGKLISPNSLQNGFKTKKEEFEILSSLIGLDSTEVSKNDYIESVKKALFSLFGDQEWEDKISYDKKSLEIHIKEITDSLANGTSSALGHCFVDFAEPEERL